VPRQQLIPDTIWQPDNGRRGPDLVPLQVGRISLIASAGNPRQQRAALWLPGGRVSHWTGQNPTEAAVTGNPDHSPLRGEHPGLVSVEELARRKGIEHIKTIEELACDGVFDTDQEVDEFLAFVTEQRHANLA
jgi:hypothetical protein